MIQNENTLVALDQSTLATFKTYEDYLSYYIQLDEASNAVSWLKADLFLHMYDNLGEGSIEELAKDIKQPTSTVVSYTRVARAFPASTRNPSISFSHHLRASYSDQYDDKNHVFLTDKRFDWVDKAADEKLSTRKLERQIKEDRIEEGEILLCTRCGLSHENLKEYAIYTIGEKSRVIKFYAGEECFITILNYIHEGTNNRKNEESSKNNSSN